jgi:hypothetical protein
MEVVHHHPGVTQRGDQGAGIAAPGVERHHGDLGQPAAWPGMEPAGHRGPGPVGHHLQQPAAFQVDQARDPPGRCDPRGLEKAGLVHPEGGHALQASSVVHQRSAVVSNRPHDGRPANPQVAGHRGHRVGVLADPPAGLGPGPFGQHSPWTDRGHPLSPGADPASTLPTAPDPLTPGQHHRPATDRQVAHPDHTAAMGLGPHPTAHATDHGGRGLHLELPLAAYHPRGEDFKAIQAEQCRPRRTTVLTHLGPPLAGRHTSASYARSQVCPEAASTPPSAAPRPTFHGEEPHFLVLWAGVGFA